jgi:hypothetical protein
MRGQRFYCARTTWFGKRYTFTMLDAGKLPGSEPGRYALDSASVKTATLFSGRREHRLCQHLVLVLVLRRLLLGLFGVDRGSTCGYGCFFMSDEQQLPPHPFSLVQDQEAVQQWFIALGKKGGAARAGKYSHETLSKQAAWASAQRKETRNRYTGTRDNPLPPSPRRVAALAKQPFYYTGQPCKNGHLALRRVANLTCTQCEAERAARAAAARDAARAERVANSSAERGGSS